jgi:flagellar basal body P-ring formation protein FlgA
MPLWAACAMAHATLPAAATAQAETLARALAQSQAPAGARVLATAGTADARLKLAPCHEVQALALPGAPAWGRTHVALRCKAGPVAWKISLPVQVQVWAPAWVAAAPLAAGHVLGEASLQWQPVDWAAGAPPLAAGASGAPPLGRELLRSLAAGQPLRESDLQARRWFASGERVTLVARGEGFAVAAEAEALGDGIEGRPARLKTAAGRTVLARPVAAGRAEVWR